MYVYTNSCECLFVQFMFAQATSFPIRYTIDQFYLQSEVYLFLKTHMYVYTVLVVVMLFEEDVHPKCNNKIVLFFIQINMLTSQTFFKTLAYSLARFQDINRCRYPLKSTKNSLSNNYVLCVLAFFPLSLSHKFGYFVLEQL